MEDSRLIEIRPGAVLMTGDRSEADVMREEVIHLAEVVDVY